MATRFIEYHGDIFIVVGYTYCSRYTPPECFVAISVKDSLIQPTIGRLYTMTIPFTWATEITDEKKIRTLKVLYGIGL